MIDIIRAMIVDYMGRNNRAPDCIIMGEYYIEELCRAPDIRSRTTPSTIFGIRIAESKDRYMLYLL